MELFLKIEKNKVQLIKNNNEILLKDIQLITIEGSGNLGYSRERNSTHSKRYFGSGVYMVRMAAGNTIYDTHVVFTK